LKDKIAALTADVAFQNGDYTAPPAKGLERLGTVWAAWLYSQEWWRKELWRPTAPAGRHSSRWSIGIERASSPAPMPTT